MIFSFGSGASAIGAAVLFSWLSGFAPEARAGFAAMAAASLAIAAVFLLLAHKAAARAVEDDVRAANEDARALRAQEVPPKRPPQVTPADLAASLDERTEKLRHAGVLIEELLRDDLDHRRHVEDFGRHHGEVAAERDELRRRVELADQAFSMWNGKPEAPRAAAPRDERLLAPVVAPDDYGLRRDGSRPNGRRSTIVALDQLEHDLATLHKNRREPAGDREQRDEHPGGGPELEGQDGAHPADPAPQDR